MTQQPDERLRTAIADAGEDAILAVIADAHPALAAKLFAASAFAIAEVDQFTQFVRDGGAPTGYNLYASTSIACVGDTLAALAHVAKGGAK